MKEQEFSNSGAVDDSQATEIGKLAGANKVVLSVVTLAGGRNMLSVKIIDVQTATIDQQKSKIVSSNDLLYAVEPLTAELLGEKVPETTLKSKPAEIASVEENMDNNATTDNSSIITACGCEIQVTDAIQGLSNYIIVARLNELKKAGNLFGEYTFPQVLDGFCPDGWRTPTFAELQCIYNERNKIGGFGNGGYYFSSKFYRMGFAGIDFDSGKEKTINNLRTANLRCIRCNSK
jgi:hypothetical protein